MCIYLGDETAAHNRVFNCPDLLSIALSRPTSRQRQ
jgi:hypothetical protein